MPRSDGGVPRSEGGVPRSDGGGGVYAVVGVYVLLAKKNTNNGESVSLWNRSVFMQKLEYIHENPVKAGLVDMAEKYKYSSASFYCTGKSEWDFLSHYEG